MHGYSTSSRLFCLAVSRSGRKKSAVILYGSAGQLRPANPTSRLRSSRNKRQRNSDQASSTAADLPGYSCNENQTQILLTMAIYFNGRLMADDLTRLRDTLRDVCGRTTKRCRCHSSCQCGGPPSPILPSVSEPAEHYRTIHRLRHGTPTVSESNGQGHCGTLIY